MCQFFSFLSDADCNLFYFDWSQRKRILKNVLKHPRGLYAASIEADSHTSIAWFYELDEDKMNKWEYNPLTQSLKLDYGSERYNKQTISDKIHSLDFHTIIKPLIIKPIVDPLKKMNKPTTKNLELLKQWASVWDSVMASVWDSVMDSVWASVRDSVRD